ncbi:MAG TPA: rhodanese-like domain-containing protein [Edaphobacter sp.]|nr:rhodanese-like domain-containing protein [Edaphobacter sp.]
MIWIAIGVVTVGALIFGLVKMRQTRKKRELEENSVGPEKLHELLDANEVLLFDVRQPLDFLAYSEIIPGAKRIPPKDLVEQTASFPRDQNSVIYCTCVNDETSRMILARARELKFTRVKILTGGLAAWKKAGYPVEPYTQAFHLDTAR